MFVKQIHKFFRKQEINANVIHQQLIDVKDNSECITCQLQSWSMENQSGFDITISNFYSKNIQGIIINNGWEKFKNI